MLLLLVLGAGGLSGCFVVSSYAYPAYVPPPSAYVPAPAPPSSSAGPATEGQGIRGGFTGTCQTVTVEGHYETRVLPGGRGETIWAPSHARQICP